uniref:Uncharacterized protein n=1 Tax=viral metagenome TaxID=1070528 RepID=A0A6M3LEW5_9ZZZZ
MEKTDKLLEGMAEKCLNILDKLLDKLDKKVDDEEFIKKMEKYINFKIKESKQDDWIWRSKLEDK